MSSGISQLARTSLQADFQTHQQTEVGGGIKSLETYISVDYVSMLASAVVVLL